MLRSARRGLSWIRVSRLPLRCLCQVEYTGWLQKFVPLRCFCQVEYTGWLQKFEGEEFDSSLRHPALVCTLLRQQSAVVFL